MNALGNEEPTNDEIAAARARNTKEVIEPEDAGPAELDYREPDPVTAPNSDPAVQSEHERNKRQAERYGI